MQVNYKKEFNIDNTNIKFLRVKIDDLQSVVEEIMENLYNISWLNNIASEELKIGFLACAEPTIKRICNDLQKAIVDDNVSDIGEYVVSNVARLIIEKSYDYYVLPLAELLKEKVSNNPGFDYHCESKESIPIFGEAKYVANSNAYGKALSQITDFIKDNKDKKEIPILNNFFSKEAIKNIVLQNKGYSISFSTTLIDTETLLNNILNNKDFKNLIKYKEIIIVAVDIR